MIWQQVVGALCSFKKLLLGTHHVLEDTVVFETKSLSWSFQVECKVIETVWLVVWWPGPSQRIGLIRAGLCVEVTQEKQCAWTHVVASLLKIVGSWVREEHS